MMNITTETCPRCHAGKLKTWCELSADEQILIERLQLSAEFSREERKKHRFCERCFFEETNSKPITA